MASAQTALDSLPALFQFLATRLLVFMVLLALLSAGTIGLLVL